MVFILTGPVHSGKTTFLKSAIAAWIEAGRKINGFLSESVWKGGVPVGYYLVDIRHGTRTLYLTRSRRAGRPQIGPYFFIPKALETARQIIASVRRNDLCVVDEVGPLELRGEGLWPALEKAIVDPDLKFFLVVRRGILREFMRMLEERGRGLGPSDDRNRDGDRGLIRIFDLNSLRTQFDSQRAGTSESGGTENKGAANGKTENGDMTFFSGKGIVSPVPMTSPGFDHLTQEIFGKRRG